MRSKKIKIEKQEKLISIFESFSELDRVRWINDSNYYSINYFRDDLRSDEKLLTHWLCYITDRQMSFKRIWDIGGYVFSSLVHAYTRERSKSVDEIIDVFKNEKIDKNNKIKYELSPVGRVPSEARNPTID